MKINNTPETETLNLPGAQTPQSRNVPAEAVHQRHDLLSGELETFRRAVFRKVLDLFLREEDLQSCAQTLSLQTHKGKTTFI